MLKCFPQHIQLWHFWKAQTETSRQMVSLECWYRFVQRNALWNYTHSFQVFNCCYSNQTSSSTLFTLQVIQNTLISSSVWEQGAQRKTNRRLGHLQKSQTRNIKMNDLRDTLTYIDWCNLMLWKVYKCRCPALNSCRVTRVHHQEYASPGRKEEEGGGQSKNCPCKQISQFSQL